jgi:hypothetical protein
VELFDDDPRIDYKPPSNLVELIEKDLEFEELEEFESSMEWDELLDIIYFLTGLI